MDFLQAGRLLLTLFVLTSVLCLAVDTTISILSPLQMLILFPLAVMGMLLVVDMS